MQYFLQWVWQNTFWLLKRLPDTFFVPRWQVGTSRYKDRAVFPLINSQSVKTERMCPQVLVFINSRAVVK